jgi:hypothetical protein
MDSGQRDVQDKAADVLGLGDSQDSRRILPITKLRKLELDGSR